MHVTDSNPELLFPVWSLGRPSTSGKSVDLIDGMMKLETADGQKAIPLFADENLARRFLERLGGKEEYKDRVPNIVRDPKELALLLEFLADKEGFTHVLIARSEEQASMATIITVRFNISMHE